MATLTGIKLHQVTGHNSWLCLGMWPVPLVAWQQVLLAHFLSDCRWSLCLRTLWVAGEGWGWSTTTAKKKHFLQFSVKWVRGTNWACAGEAAPVLHCSCLRFCAFVSPIG